MDSNAYAGLVKSVLSEYGGMENSVPFPGTLRKCCVNAHNALMSTNLKRIGVQDQVHAADLLMKYLGKTESIQTAIEKVCDVGRETRKNRKFLARIRANVFAFNKTIRGRCPNNNSPTMLGGLPEVLKTAFMLCKASRTRFASHESVLEAFPTTRNILVDILGAPEFIENIFDPRGSRDRARRTKYKDKIESISLFRQVRELHNVMRLCRRHLRKLDSDEGRVYDVVREAIALQTELENITHS